MKGLCDCALFGVLAIAAMLVLVLSPGDNGRVIVLLSKGSSPSQIYAVLDGSEGRVVDVLGSHSFLVESDQQGFVEHLYQKGAVLVVDGSARLGCGKAKLDKKAGA